MTNITLEERKQILQDAIRFKKTDRIPTCSNYWTYIVLHENLKLSEAFYDYDVLLNALSSFHEQYEFDTYAYSGDRNPFLVTETLDGNLYIVNDETGHINCGDNVLMDPSEYSELIANPQKFIWEKAIPRKCKALNNPDAPERVKDTVREYKKFSDFNAAYDQKFVNEYHVPRRAAGYLIFGFDYLFNYLRGIKGTSIDLRRRYDQVMDAIEAIENMLGVPNYLASMDAPIDDGYVFGTTVGLLGHSILSPKQFGRIYHPNMKKVCDKNAELGRLVNIFSEATFARFYEYFEDIPKGVACALVEQDDLFEMRKRLPNIAICGGMPTALLGGGTKEECIDYGKKLIDGLACDGGFLMSQDKMMSYRNDAKPENIMAIQELCRTYTG